jgi:cytochrome c
MDSYEVNKIAGAALAAALLLFGGKTLLEIATHEKVAKEPGHRLAIVAAKATGPAAASAFNFKAIEDNLKKVSDANVEAGKDVFKKCAACHTPNKGGENKVGPNMWGIMGRKVGAHPGFAYSEALKNQGGEWTYGRFAGYIWDPRGAIPGNKMAFAGVQDTKDLTDLIAYMRTTADAPLPLPQ